MAETSSTTASGIATESSEAAPLEGMRHYVRRKTRMIAICLECRKRKIKCDKQYPCWNCTKFSRECLYLAPAMELMARQRAAPSAIASNETSAWNQLDGRDANLLDQGRSSSGPSLLTPLDDTGLPPHPAIEDLSVNEYEHYLEPIPTGAVSVSYGDDYGNPEIDLGVSIGKMWMTDRIGGLLRPHIHKEIDRLLRDSSLDRRTMVEKQRPLAPLPDEGRNFLGPQPGYAEPRLLCSSFHNSGVQRDVLLELLSSKSATDALLERYYASVHSITPTLHWPTFQHQYGVFWRTLAAGLEPAAWLQALVFATLFAATASIAGENMSSPSLSSSLSARDRMQSATEHALRTAGVLHGTRLEVLQALITLLLPMYSTQVSRAHTSLVGMAISLGESMGLHKEPPPGLPERERHVRRLLWFHLSTLDLRAAYAHSARLFIREDAYDTKMPANVDEVGYGTVQCDDGCGWSAMTFCRIRFECMAMQKTVWHDREKLEKKEILITHCLGKIEFFRKEMETKYGRHLDLSKPIQKYTRLVLDVLVHTCYVMVLFRYLKQYGQKIPDRFRQLTLHAAVLAMESAIEMDRSVDLMQWKYHNGSYQQWQIAFLLLSHINRTPDQPQAHRIWKIIDYVFEIDPCLSPAMKVRSIMTIVGDRTRAYQDARMFRTLDVFNQNPTTNESKMHEPHHHGHNPISGGQLETASNLVNPAPTTHKVTSVFDPQSQLFAKAAGNSIARPNSPRNSHLHDTTKTLRTPTHETPMKNSFEQFHDLTSPNGSSAWTDSWTQDLEMADAVDWKEWDQIFPDMYSDF